MSYRVGLGQDSHRYLPTGSHKKLILGGLEIPGWPGFDANSDGDVVLHALTNAISSLTGKPILGFSADALCKAGITDSSEYVKLGLADLKSLGRITQVSISLELQQPVLKNFLDSVRQRVAKLLHIPIVSCGLTVHSGEGLTTFGQGLGAFATVLVTIEELQPSIQ